MNIKWSLRNRYRSTLTRSTPASIISSAQSLISSSNLTIALYNPIEDEPNLLKLIQPSNIFCLPKMVAGRMVFVPYKFGDELKYNTSYPLILEPKNEEMIVPDVMFVPGIAFDIRGNRLGRGKGYYDKYIAQYPQILTIGVIFQEKLLDSLPSDPHDCRMHFIITEH